MNRVIIIGSKALEYYGIYPNREPKDTDLILEKEMSLPHGSEAIVDNTLFNIIFKYCNQNSVTQYLEPDLMLTLKLSHINHNLKNNSWGKHCHDIKLLYGLGYSLNQELLDELYTYWNNFYKDKDHIKLNKSSNDFFKADYNQNHDKLHTYFAYEDEPMYKKFLRDGSDVAVDKNKWNSLSLEQQYNAVLEESMVLAYERNLPLTYGFKHLLTKCSKGWFNKFMVDNFYKLLNLCKEETNRFIHIKNQLKQKGY